MGSAEFFLCTRAVCVFVCERDRERERESGGGREGKREGREAKSKCIIDGVSLSGYSPSVCAT